MAENDQLSEQEAFFKWLEELDLEQPLSALVDHLDPPESLPLESEDIERLEELGKELAGELLEREAVPALPAMDMDERLLEPEQTLDVDHDHDVDR